MNVKEKSFQKNICFIFQCSPLTAPYTSPTFPAITLTPLTFKPGRHSCLDVSII